MSANDPNKWRHADGKPVEPFTVITKKDIDSGKYVFVGDPSEGRTLQYMFGEAVLWPDHTQHVIKGDNPDVEHYSAMSSEVIKEDEPFKWPQHCMIGDIIVSDGGDTSRNETKSLLQLLSDYPVIDPPSGGFLDYSSLPKTINEKEVRIVDPTKIELIDRRQPMNLLFFIIDIQHSFLLDSLTEAADPVQRKLVETVSGRKFFETVCERGDTILDNLTSVGPNEYSPAKRELLEETGDDSLKLTDQ